MQNINLKVLEAQIKASGDDSPETKKMLGCMHKFDKNNTDTGCPRTSTAHSTAAMQDRVQESTRAVAEVTIRRQLRNVFHPSMIAVVAGACCCTSLMMYGFDPDSARQMEWHDFVQNTGAQVANHLGGLQAFLLAFRLNVCYQGSHSPCTPHCRCALF